ncbi:Sphingoid long-chain base transporter RSB1 [Colletotrichum sp. SAR 10_76]|uniref:Sphingoid long-chain base transporter RSB1 n=1 Tax=Colletotrichum siamense TaxID=690259 RepID=UPI0018723F92|nr:Sphingoid long-chain base transporter RSB1 [Colletotrichum siamense]KAF5500791.1 Sphingoid long-chain base transporter RSB1 [Colletotrichum siamense]KAI8208233.1 Sphingoid long-chain base transporter RSB1 [Colletotrichum sp. SAR 10_76]
MAGPPPPLPPYVVVFGPDANCTLEICDIHYSLYRYRPNIAVNALFLALYGIAGLVHIFLGIRWRSYWFMTFMVLGCLSEIVGYIGRIMLYHNPFAFVPFMLQIVFITSGPVWYTAAIYVTLSKAITHLGPELARLPPKALYWVFIALDVSCLVIQAAGGAISTDSKGDSDLGVNLAMGGLVIQVVVIVVFCAVFADYMIRYTRSSYTRKLTQREKIFFGFLALAVALILARCSYRVDELSEGYSNSTKVTDEGLFIGLEGVLIVLAVFSLCLGHPGLAFENKTERAEERKESQASVESAMSETTDKGRSRHVS